MRSVSTSGGVATARLSSSTLTPGSPRKPSPRPSVFSSISRSTAPSDEAVGLRRRARAWSSAYAGEMCGSSPEPEAVTASAGTSDSSTPSRAATSALRSPMEAMRSVLSGPRLLGAEARVS